MPKNLTDLYEWATIAVPVGTDPATAASVETPFQLLANRTRWLLNLLHGFALSYLNLNEADTTGVSTFDLANVMAGCIRVDKDGVRDHTIIDNDGETATCMHSGKATPTPGGGGVLWDDEADTPNASLTWTAAATRVDICGSWGNDVVPERCAVSNSATGQVAYSSSLGNWGAVAGGVSGTLWSACEYGKPGSGELWAIGGAAGALATSTNISSSAFTSRTSGLSGIITRIRSNRKNDASDHAFLAVDDTGSVSISNADGSSWTATAAGSLGLTSTIESIAWDSLNDRWVAIQYNGFRAWSSNGIAWTESSGTNIPDFTVNSSNIFSLDCDDQGNLILGVYNSVSPQRALVYVGPNGGDGLANGLIWEEVFWPSLYTYAKIVFMGHGRIITAGSGGVCYSDAGLGTRWLAS